MDPCQFAKKIVQTLANEGYTAYFAGGWVRDFVMGHPSSDIDIATDAPPQKILDLFPRTIHVGLAFGVVVVPFDGKTFEVSTFRRDLDYLDGRKPSRIEPASPREDAQRRDFTINGMFYDPLKEALHDYVGGRRDLERGVIRAIGNPDERFDEDRLRMIRAVRFAARFGFRIDPDTEKAIRENAERLFPAVSMERIWQEFCKIAKYREPGGAFLEMHRLGLLGVIFPELKKTPLRSIKERVAHFSSFPEKSPEIAYLLELFPEFSRQKAEELCRYLRTSNRDLQFAQFLLSAKEMVSLEKRALASLDLCDWCHFYAHPDSELCLQILSSALAERERERFLRRHLQQREEYRPFIERIQKRNPVVTSSLLRAEGVKPGISMGELLKEAERIAIRERSEDPKRVLSLLKSSAAWP